MNKPVKPRKFYTVECGSSTGYPFKIADRLDKNIRRETSLKDLLSWIKANVPKEAYDVGLFLEDNKEFGSWLHISWKQKLTLNNVGFETEMQKYKKQLAKWKEGKTK